MYRATIKPRTRPRVNSCVRIPAVRAHHRSQSQRTCVNVGEHGLIMVRGARGQRCTKGSSWLNAWKLMVVMLATFFLEPGDRPTAHRTCMH